MRFIIGVTKFIKYFRVMEKTDPLFMDKKQDINRLSN